MAHDPVVAGYGISAVIMVQATADAEAICQKNKLSAIDVLRPFGRVEQTLTLATVGDPYKLHSFAMRFVHTTEFQEVERNEQHVARLLSSHDCEQQLKQAEAADLDGVAGPLPPLTSTSTPWLSAFRAQLAASLRHTEGTTLDHPVGCVLLASASQPKPVAVFNALSASANLTSVIADGSADAGISKTYILLHDVSVPDADETGAQHALAEISRAFGASACHLLPFNSRRPDAQLPADVWTAARPVLHSPPSATPPPPLPSDSPIAHEDVIKLRAIIEGPLLQQVHTDTHTHAYASCNECMHTTIEGPLLQQAHTWTCVHACILPSRGLCCTRWASTPRCSLFPLSRMYAYIRHMHTYATRVRRSPLAALAPPHPPTPRVIPPTSHSQLASLASLAPSPPRPLTSS